MYPYHEICPLPPGAMKLEILQQALCQDDGQEIFQWQVALEIGTGFCRGFHLCRRCLDRSRGMKSRRQTVGLLGYFSLPRPVLCCLSLSFSPIGTGLKYDHAKNGVDVSNCEQSLALSASFSACSKYVFTSGQWPFT